MNGKGDKPRPLGVSKKKFDENWALIFGRKKNDRITFRGHPIVWVPSMSDPSVTSSASKQKPFPHTPDS